MVFIINLVFFILSFLFLKNRPFSLFVITFFCFQLVVGVGIPFVKLMDMLIGYKMPITGLDVVQWYYIVFSLVFLLFYFFLEFVLEYMGFVGKKYELLVHPYDKPAFFLLAMFSLFCALVYVSLTGLSFGSSGYESRYEEARGVGFLIIFFPAFIPFMVARFIELDTTQGYFRNIILWLFVGFSTYIILQGYRQILIAIVLFVGLFLVNRRVVSSRFLFFGVFILMPSMLISLSFLRYSGEDSTVFTSGLEAALYFIQGDLFPVDAILKTSIYLEQYTAPGMSVFWEHFYRFVPRILMENKPEILMNAAGFYTLEVVGYSRGVTLSPTILSEGLMISGGWIGVVGLAFFASFFCFVYDVIIRTTKKYSVYIFLLSYLYMGFFIVREGLQAGLYRAFLVFLFFILFLFFRFFVEVLDKGKRYV